MPSADGPDEPGLLPSATLPSATLPSATLPSATLPAATISDKTAATPVLVRTLTICNRRGLHARAAARFVTTAERFGAAVDVVRDGQVVSARSIMGLMMLGAGIGSQVELRAEGFDAKEAMDALVTLIEAGFHEQD